MHRNTPAHVSGHKTPRPKFSVDFPLLFVSLALLIWGLIVMYSSSAFWGEFYKKDSSYFFKRQAVFAAVGFMLMLLMARYYSRIRDRINPGFLLLATWVALIAALLCRPVANVHRWITLGPVNIQPSEFAKITLLFCIAGYLDSHKTKIIKTGMALVAPLTFTAITLALIGIAPDLGTPVLMFSVVMMMFMVAGAKLKNLLGWAAAAVPVLAYELFHYSYRLKRLMSFMSPEEQASGIGYQLNQSLTAVGAGGWFGTGLGASKMKLLYLPAPHTDFIFSVMCEELGLMRVLIIIGLFCFFLIRGIKIAKHAEPFSNSMLALGITLTITLQAFFNMAMSVGIIPTKGLPLPFFSYGGSSILSTLTMTGILLNISAKDSMAPKHTAYEHI